MCIAICHLPRLVCPPSASSQQFPPTFAQYRTCGVLRARLASLVPTGPGGGTWATGVMAGTKIRRGRGSL